MYQEIQINLEMSYIGNALRLSVLILSSRDLFDLLMVAVKKNLP